MKPIRVQGAKAFNKLIGANIQAVRHARWTTLPELARESKVSKGCLSKIENGKGNPTIETLFKPSKALKVEIAAILRT